MNSPIRRKTNSHLSTLKNRKSINDIIVDKESLIQLNRATNQLFSQKVKETIFNPNHNKLVSFEETGLLYILNLLFLFIDKHKYAINMRKLTEIGLKDNLVVNSTSHRETK